jgi:hypothetical protein
MENKTKRRVSEMVEAGLQPPGRDQPDAVSRQCCNCGEKVPDDVNPFFTSEGKYAVLRIKKGLQEVDNNCQCPGLKDHNYIPQDKRLQWLAWYSIQKRHRGQKRKALKANVAGQREQA